MGGGLRYFGAAVGFGFAAVWIMASLAGALVCLLAAAVGFGSVFLAQRVLTKRAVHTGGPDISTPSPLASPSRTPDEELPLSADELNHDLGYLYEPSTASPHLAAGAEYGWPPSEDTEASNETPDSGTSG